MPHNLLRHTSRGGRHAVLQDGADHWLVPFDDTTRASELHINPVVNHAFIPVGYTSTGETCTTAELDRITARRRTQAASILLTYHSAAQYKPLTVEQISVVLEDEYLAALAEAPPDATRINTARTKLVGFLKRQKGLAGAETYRYSLADNFVGETAHIHGAWKLKSDTTTIQYRCTTHAPSQKFRAFMELVPPVGHGAVANHAKTHINEFLVAPRTAGRSAQAHEEVMRSFVHGIASARRLEIAQWVTDQFDGYTANPGRLRVGIWVRNVVGDGHGADQNMSRLRFRKILTAARQAGVHDIILLGDGLPHANWLDHPHGAPYYFRGWGERWQARLRLLPAVGG